MKAQDIKAGTTFSENGKVVWTALTDGVEYWMSDEKLVRVIVQYRVDGGRDARYFDWGQEVNFEAPEEN
jgi:hypothetical protein